MSALVMPLNLSAVYAVDKNAPPIARYRSRMATQRSTGESVPRRLDTEAVVRAALGVAEERGIDGVSMRVVAERVGVTPMALYHYVETKDLLVKLVADAVIAQITLPDTPAVEWRSALTTALEDYRTTVSRYPGVAAVLLHGGLLPRARQLVAWQLDLLEAAGFTPEQARRAYAAFHLLMLGRLTVDEARRTAAERGPAHARDEQVDAYLAELQGETAFTEALRILLDALEAQLPARDSAAHPIT
jgi:AcrR family transcriptional regulator